MTIWVIVHTNGTFYDMTGTSYFKTEKEGMDEFKDLTSQNMIDYHHGRMESYNVRLEKVILGDDMSLGTPVKEFTYIWESGETYSY